MKPRLCKDCIGRMRPTRNMHVFSPTLRMFRCVDCGAEHPWLDNPVMNGAHAELHKMDDGSFSVLSMMSDPLMEWGEPKKKSSRKRKVRAR